MEKHVLDSSGRDKSPKRGKAPDSIYQLDPDPVGVYDAADPYNLAREARAAELQPWTVPWVLHPCDSYEDVENGDVLRLGYLFDKTKFGEGAYKEVLQRNKKVKRALQRAATRAGCRAFSSGKEHPSDGHSPSVHLYCSHKRRNYQQEASSERHYQVHTEPRAPKRTM